MCSQRPNRETKKKRDKFTPSVVYDPATQYQTSNVTPDSQLINVTKIICSFFIIKGILTKGLLSVV